MKRKGKTMKKIILLIVLIFLSGCASIQEICTSYGFSPGTESFSNCMMSENQHRQRNRQQAWVSLREGARENARQNQEMYRGIQESFKSPSMLDRGFNCDTFNTGGGNSSTNCY